MEVELMNLTLRRWHTRLSSLTLSIILVAGACSAGGNVNEEASNDPSQNRACDAMLTDDELRDELKEIERRYIAECKGLPEGNPKAHPEWIENARERFVVMEKLNLEYLRRLHQAGEDDEKRYQTIIESLEEG